MQKKKRREYDNEFPSVTMVLGVLRKVGLEMWYKYNTAKFCDEKSQRGKLIGTQIHEAIESYVLNEKVEVVTDYEEEVKNALRSFMLFRKENPEYVLEWAEMMLTSKEHGYNGTMDCMAKVNGVPIVMDWKTGECKKEPSPKIYDEYKYQVSAYVSAYNEMKGASVEEALVVSFAKDAVAYSVCRLNKDEIDGCFRQVFLPCLSIYNFQQKGGKDVRA